MAREKKITVKPQLNREANARHLTIDSGPRYPLYFQVIYNRSYTKFPYGNNLYSLDQEANLVNDSGVKSNIRSIERIVRLESSRNPEFTLKGFATTLRSYLTDLNIGGYLAASHILEQRLRKVISADEIEEFTLISLKERVGFGKKFIDENGWDDIKNFVKVGQYGPLMHEDIGSVLDWLTGISGKEKMEAVREAKKIAFDPKYNISKGMQLDFIKKDEAIEDTVKHFDELCFYLIDNELFVENVENESTTWNMRDYIWPE